MYRPIKDVINAAPLCFQENVELNAYDEETASKEKLSKAVSKVLGTATAVLTMLVDLLTFFIMLTFVIGRSVFLMGSCLEEVCSKIYRLQQRENLHLHQKVD